MKKLPALFALLMAGSFPAIANAQIYGPTTTFTEQLSVGVQANSINGKALGGQYSVKGSGLATTNLYKLGSNGLFTVSNGAAAFTTNLNESFSYNATARSADSVSTVGLSGTVSSGNYKSSGTYLDAEAIASRRAQARAMREDGSSKSFVNMYEQMTNRMERHSQLLERIADQGDVRIKQGARVQSSMDAKDFPPGVVKAGNK